MKRFRRLKHKLIQLFLYLTVLQAGVVETSVDSLPCEAEEEDPDEENPMDNLSCPFADELQCISVSELCNGASVCMGGYDEGGPSDDEEGFSGSGGIPTTFVLECSTFFLPIAVLIFNIECLKWVARLGSTPQTCEAG